MNLDKFAEWLLRRGRDPDTVDLYVADVRIAFAHPRGPIGLLTSREYAPKSLRHFLAALRAYSKFSGDTSVLQDIEDAHGLLIRLPAPQRKTPRKPLTKDEWHAFLDACEASRLRPPVRAVCALMARAGFRVGDVLRMQRSEITRALREGVLSIETKGKRRLEFSVKHIRTELETLAEPKGWMVVAELISPRSKRGVRAQAHAARDAIERAVRVIAEEAGITPMEMYPHRLRRTFAVLFLEESGGHIEDLMQVMQWANIQTAYQYVDFSRRTKLEGISDKLFED